LSISKKIQFHVFAIALASLLSFGIVELFFLTRGQSEEKRTLISGKQTLFRGTQANYASGIQAEIEWMAALKNKKNIVILGSSELGTLPRSPYLEFPDSLHIPTIGFGHAFHQSFSMYCQLLAGREHLKNAKICIIFSPSWLETEGTNVQAFLEFVPINYLRKIIHDDTISKALKNHIGEFIYRNEHLIDNPNHIYKFFKNSALTRNKPFIQEKLDVYRNNISSVHYDVKTLDLKKSTKKLPENYQKQMDFTKNEFIRSVTNNSIFVNNAYYSEYVIDQKTGKPRTGQVQDSNYINCQEMKDFLLLIEILHHFKVDASVVIQPLNNYHYSGSENLNPAIQSIEKNLKARNIPYLNLFAYNKLAFEPAVLTDIMHLGNYGWMKINQFLYNTYVQ
jgi:D-alanine transfer protein